MQSTQQLIQQQTMQQLQQIYPSKVAFQNFPEIIPQDDRVRCIAKQLYENLQNFYNQQEQQPDPNKQIEIEAKLGQLVFSQQNMSYLETHLMMSQFSFNFWTILQDPKPPRGGKALYQFQAGVVNQDSEQKNIQKQIFYALQQELSRQATVNRIFKESYQQTKDETFRTKSDQIRKSFLFNDKTKQYDPQPYEILRKQRVSDINVKKGTDLFVYKQDFRITTSIEEKITHQIGNEYRMDSIRIKKRHKYLYTYMTFDLTETQRINPENNQVLEENFEVEAEITDVNHLRQNLQNYEQFVSIIRRFLQNIGGLMNLVHDIIRNSDQMIQQNQSELMNQYQEDLNRNYKQFYDNAPKSIVGDYLSSVATAIMRENQ
eukprot:403359456